MSDLNEGDKVCLQTSWRWTQPWQKFAEERRIGEVARVFTPVGDHQPTYCIRFPVKRKGATPRQIFLKRHDLVLADALPRPHPQEDKP